MDSDRITNANAESNLYLRSLRRNKRIFAICLFSSTLLAAWVLRQKRARRMKDLLEHCVQIPVDKEKFGTNVSLYKYCDFIFPGQIIKSGVFLELPHFEFRDDDIVVASFPKSGTTWVQEIVYMLKNNFKPSDGSSEVLETRFPYLEYPYPGIKTVANLSGKRYIKTHLPFSLLPESFGSSGTKLIYIVRNPKDIAVSYWHFMKLLSTVDFKGSFEDFVDMFVSDKVPYGPYYEHLRSYIDQKHNDNILVISYEDLKENPCRVISSIAEFLVVPVTDAEILQVAVATTFRSMADNPSVNYEHWKDIGFAKKDEGKFLRKGEVGDWKNYFRLVLLHRFNEWEKTNAKKIDFNMRYEINGEK